MVLKKLLNTIRTKGIKGFLKKMFEIIFEVLKKTPLSLYVAFSNQVIIVSYSDDHRNVKNFGDALNPILISALSGKKVISYNKIFNLANKTVYSVIGSVLDKKHIKSFEVWGSGFISNEGKFRTPPVKIHAIRGPLTRELVLKQGLPCPKVYGDPALLLPIIYQPQVSKKYKVGLIPHYVDKENEFIKHFQKQYHHEVIIIDIEDDIYNVVDAINACEVIASSSLHGIIVSDAYGVPSCWIKLSDNIRGGEFKFLDYFMSVQRVHHHPYEINQHFSMEDLLRHVPQEHLIIDTEHLLSVCPFLKSSM